jgi:hypothetical protein
MAFVPGGKQIAVRHTGPQEADAVLTLYDATTGKPGVSVTIKGGGALPDGDTGVPTPRSPATCAISPKGDWIVYGEGPELRFLAIPPHNPVLPGGGRMTIATGREPGCNRLWLDENGETAILDRGGNRIYALERWDLTKQSRIDRLPRHLGAIDLSTLAVSPSAGRVAAAFEEDGKRLIACWTLERKLSPVKIMSPRNVTCGSLAISPDGKTVAAGYGDGTVGWYEADTGKPVRHIQPLGQFGVWALAFHPGGKHIACGTYDKRGQPNLFAIRIDTGAIIARLDADPRGVSAVRFSPSGDRLATFGESGVISVWDANVLLKLQRD